MGVDGSDASQEALRWAVEEARLRSAPLVAVHAWSFVPPQPIGDPGMLAMPAGDLPGQLSAESEAARISGTSMIRIRGDGAGGGSASTAATSARII